MTQTNVRWGPGRLPAPLTRSSGVTPRLPAQTPPTAMGSGTGNGAGNNDDSGGGDDGSGNGDHQAPLPEPAVETLRSSVDWSTKWVAVGSLFIAGAYVQLSGGVSTMTVVVLAMLPVWLSAVPKFKGARFLLLTSVVCVIWGVLLGLWGQSSGVRGFDAGVAFAQSVHLLSWCGCVGLVLWARTVLSLHTTALVLGSGLLIHGVMTMGGSANPWKFQVGLPTAIVVLALARGRTKHAIVGLGALIAASVAFDSRSYAGMMFVALLMTLWAARRKTTSKNYKRWSAALLIVVGLTSVYQIGTTLMLEGALGSKIQARTAAQVKYTGSLLAGGRVEMHATMALVPKFPAGFGAGAVPSATDKEIARPGLVKTKAHGVRGYANNYMFKNQFKLHSVLSDLWSQFGLAGVVLAGTLLFWSCNNVISRLAYGNLDPLMTLSVMLAIWAMGFGPIFKQLPDVVIGFALSAMPLVQAGRDDSAQ